MSARIIRAALSLLVVCSVAPAWAQGPLPPGAALPPAHPPMGGGPSTPGHGGLPSGHPGSLRAPTAGPVVVVERVAASGAASAAVGVEVTLERVAPQRGMGGDSDIVEAWLATTDETGRAYFPVATMDPAKPGERRPRVRYAGVSYPGAAIADATREVAFTVFEPTGDRAQLALEITLELALGEGRFFVRQQTRLLNNGLEVVTADGVDGGVRIPLLLPTVFGAPVDFGVVPQRPDPDRVTLTRDPAIGRLQVDRGALMYRGPIPPGAALTVSARYPIPYDEVTSLSLGLRPPLDVERLTLVSRVPSQASPRFAPRRPHRPFARALSRGTERVMVIDTPPKADEPVFIDIARLPGRESLFRPLAFSGVILLVALFLLALIAGRARRQVAPVEDR